MNNADNASNNELKDDKVERGGMISNRVYGRYGRRREREEEEERK